MFFKKSKIDNIESQINEMYNKEKEEKKQRLERLDTDTYASYELDKIVSEHQEKLKTIKIEELGLDTVFMGTELVYYYPIGESAEEQVYSRRELEYMKKRFKKLGFRTQIAHSYGFTPYIYLRLLWGV